MFQLFNDAAGDKFAVGLGGGEVEEVAAVKEGRTADADMDAFHAVGVQHLGLVA